MVGLGLTKAEIASFLSVSESTVSRKFKEELRRGRVKANAAVVQALYRNAVNGNVAAQIFWAKTRLGWRENAAPEGADKGKQPPQQVKLVIEAEPQKPS